MKISVVVPVYNVERSLLAACMKSLRLQSLPSDDYEVIIVDDCSDASETLTELQRQNTAENTRIVRHAVNRGLNEARRSGVKAALGDFVIFVDSDDMLTRDGLELLRMEAQRSKADIVTSEFQRWNPAAKELTDAPFLAFRFLSP